MQKIYVDSRERVSGTCEDFWINLPYSLTIPKESFMILDRVVIPNTMKTITAGVNDRLYYLEYGLVDGIPTGRFTVKYLQPGYYDTTFFALELQTVLNTDKLVSEDYRVGYNTILDVFVIKNNFPSPHDYFYMQTQERLKSVDLPFPDTDRSNLMDCCRELGMLYNKDGQFNAGGGFDLAKEMILFYSPVLQPHFDLFIHFGVVFRHF